MEQQHKKLTEAPASSPAASSASGSSPSSSSRSIHGSMSSAFLGVSSSMTPSQQSQPRRSSPSLYPPPRAPFSGHLASRSAAASGGSASGSSSSSQSFHQIPPSPGTAAKRRPRPNSRLTHSLPTPFLSELSSIRRMGANLFGDLNAQEMMPQQRPLLHGQHQQQEMTRPSSSSSSMLPQHHTPTTPSGEFSGFPSASPLITMLGGFPGFAPPPLQQQQAQPSSFSTLQPLPGGNFSGFSFPLPASSQTQQMQPSSSSTDLTGRIFSGSELLPLAPSQHFSNFVAPLPSWTTTFFQTSSSCSALAPSSDSELPPLPPSLEIPQYGLPPLGQLSSSSDNGSSTFDQSRSGYFVQPSETYELAPLPESLQMPPLLSQQEPVVVAPPRSESEIISLDNGDVDELSALVNSFASSSHGHGHDGSASLPSRPMHEQPTNLELEGMQRVQLGSTSSELSMNGVGVGQTTLEAAMPTPAPASVHDKVNNGGGSSSSIPMPMYSLSLSEEEALHKLRDLLSKWSSSAGSSSDQSMGSSAAGSSCQDRAAVPELANKFGTMSIGGSSSSVGTNKRPWNYSSLSENSTPAPAVPNKLILGGMDRRHGLPPRSPALGAGASSSMSRRGGTKEHYFSEAEMETINKDNRLKELFETDSKRVKRLLRNREYASRLKDQKENHLQDVQGRVDALKMECSSLSAKVQSEQETIANLMNKNREMEIKIQGLQEQVNLSQDLNNQLQSEVQRLKQLEHNMLCANNPERSHMAGCSASSTNGLHQLPDSHANDLVSSHQVQALEHTPQLKPEEQPHQAVDDDELMGQQQ